MATVSHKCFSGGKSEQSNKGEHHVSGRKEENERTLGFSVDGHLLRELGEKLVARPSIALAELVKNAYDADATYATLRFKDISNIGGTIEIEDDGHGMSIDDVERTWMKIATGEKREHPLSPKYGRNRVGEKGIGRFACQILADELLLESVSDTKRGKEKITASFIWKNYWSKPDLRDTRVRFEVLKVPDETPSGTKLVLKKTRQVWSKEAIGNMRRDILSLINPFSWELTMKQGMVKGKTDPGFSIRFDIPEMEEFEGALSDYFLEAAWGALEGKVAENGSAVLTVESWKGTRDRYRLHKTYNQVGPFSFKIHWFRRKPEEYEGFEFGIREVQRAGREHGGVRVYLDGFRVFPFGDPGDDWLEVDKERAARTETAPKLLEDLVKSLYRPMLLLPANNQLVGAVFLTRKYNPGIVVSVTRDRLVENAAYLELAEVVKFAVRWMTLVYAKETEEDRRAQRRSEKKKSKSLLQTMRETIKEGMETPDPELRKTMLRTIQDLTTSLEEQMIEEEEEIMAVVDLYQVLASTGTMVGILGHELVALTEALEKTERNLEEISREIPTNPRNRLISVNKDLGLWRQFVDELSTTLGAILSKDSRDQRIGQVVSSAVDIVVSAFRSYCTDNGIDVKNYVPETLCTPPMFLAQLYSIIANLLTNAIKWVMFGEDRRIEFGGRITKNGTEFWILDSGSGVPVAIREEVFKPFVSYSTPDLKKGTGTGLGLTIVRNFVTEAGGDVEFIDPPERWNTCCIIRFRGQ